MKLFLSLLYRSAPYLAVVLSMLSISPSATAFSGYCMTRSSYEDEWVKAEDLDFSACNQRNEKEDEDDVFAREGLIYWDSSNLY